MLSWLNTVSSALSIENTGGEKQNHQSFLLTRNKWLPSRSNEAVQCRQHEHGRMPPYVCLLCNDGHTMGYGLQVQQHFASQPHDTMSSKGLIKNGQLGS